MQTGYLSIPIVSDMGAAFAYSPTMPKKGTPLGWGQKFKSAVFAKELSLAVVAERMGLAESTLRSWTNGTREVNLSDFLKLCKAAGIDPALILFSGHDEKFLAIGEAWNKAGPLERGVLWTAAQGILAQHGANKAATGS